MAGLPALPGEIAGNKKARKRGLFCGSIRIVNDQYDAAF